MRTSAWLGLLLLRLVGGCQTETLLLDATVRDVWNKKDTDLGMVRHIDFEMHPADAGDNSGFLDDCPADDLDLPAGCPSGCKDYNKCGFTAIAGLAQGMVQPDLGADLVPVYRANGADASKPKKSIHDAESFYSWYHDVDYQAKINIQVELKCDNEMYTYADAAFFPADEGGNEGEELFEGDDGKDHNFGFTTEIHTTFVMKENLWFEFAGDDDVWVFIDGKLAIDIGGLHLPICRRISLDTDGNVVVTHGSIEKEIKDVEEEACPERAFPEENLKLEPMNIGTTHSLDFFHAERHTTGSNFKMTTNMDLIAATRTPTTSPTGTPTTAPTVAPTISPTNAPSLPPTVSPTLVPTATPTATPTLVPTAAPTLSPTKIPTLTPTNTPTAQPTQAPTPPPVADPTPRPTAVPTVAPTATPTAAPTAAPTTAPTKTPTVAPTTSPTARPTDQPTRAPTNLPTSEPTNPPVADPTPRPSRVPTVSPTASPTVSPTASPTVRPTNQPTNAPTKQPTFAPTNEPTNPPVADPTPRPSRVPTVSPTAAPTKQPTFAPTNEPTNPPVADPTPRPSRVPTVSPTASPTNTPTNQPTLAPTKLPTPIPTMEPTPKPRTVVTFDANGGTFTELAISIISEDVDVGVDALLPQNGYRPDDPKKTPAEFLGWYVDPELPVGVPTLDTFLVMEPTTLYAIWSTSMEIIFDANGGQFTSTQVRVSVEVDIGIDVFVGEGRAYVPANPALSDSVFLGWSIDPWGYATLSTYVVVSPATLYAVWTIPVTFDANGGDFGVGGKELVVQTEHGDDVFIDENGYIPVDPSRDDAKFIGWSPTPQGEDLVTTHIVTQPTTFYAVWDSGMTVTFDSNGGSFVSGLTLITPVEIGDNALSSTYRAPDPTHPNQLEFLGWYASKSFPPGSSVLDEFVVTRPAILYAVWSVPVTFDANGGTFDPSTVVIVVDATPGDDVLYGPTSVAPDDPAKPPTVFVGWYSAPRLPEGTSVLTRLVVTEPTTLYAVYLTAVTFDANGGMFGRYRTSVTVPVEFGLDALLVGGIAPTNDMTRPSGDSGVEFVGWFTAQELPTDQEPLYTFIVQEPATLYAIWDTVVRFDANGGTFPPRGVERSIDVVVNYYDDAIPLAPATPPRQGDAIFLGWYPFPTLPATEDVLDTFIVNRASTLYAIWGTRVTFDANGGRLTGNRATVTASLDYGADAFSVAPADPTQRLSQAEFLGWSATPELEAGADVLREYIVSKPATLYAIWTITVTYDANGGKIPSRPTPKAVVSVEAVRGDDAIAIAPADPVGGSSLLFLGWSTEKTKGSKVLKEYTVDAPVTLYAIWEPADVQVTFDANGGKFSRRRLTIAVDVSFGDDALESAPTDPTQEPGFVFVGWHTRRSLPKVASVLDSFIITSPQPKVLYAIWEARAIPLTFDSNGGTFTRKRTTVEVQLEVGDEALKRAPEDPTRTPSHTFVGWSKTPNGGSPLKSFRVTIPTTLYAIWEPVVLDLTFDANGGNFAKRRKQIKVKVGYGDDAFESSPANPAQQRHTFVGWFTAASLGRDQTILSPPFPVTKSVTLFAVWEPVVIPVTFDANGGEFAKRNPSVVVEVGYDNDAIPEAPAQPIRKGAEFVGWHTKASLPLDGDVLDSYTVKKPVTLWAIWRVEIIFDANGGSFQRPDTFTRPVVVRYGDDALPDYEPTSPVRLGGVFLGWAKGPEQSVVDSFIVTEPTVLYAQWEVEITFDGNGGRFETPAGNKLRMISLPKLGEDAFGKKYDYVPADPIKLNNDVFAGWSTQQNLGPRGKLVQSHIVRAPVTFYAIWAAPPPTAPPTPPPTRPLPLPKPVPIFPTPAPPPSGSPPTVRAPSPPPPTPYVGPQCPPPAADIVMVIDGSASVGKQLWADSLIPFLSQLVDEFPVSRDGVHFAMLQFASDTQEEFYLDDYTTTAAVHQALTRVQYLYGLTAIAPAMNVLSTVMFKRGRRPDVPLIAVILTDGNPTLDRGLNLVEEATRAKQDADLIVALGVGAAVSDTTLQLIASDSSTVLRVESYESVASALAALLETICYSRPAGGFAPGLQPTPQWSNTPPPTYRYPVSNPTPYRYPVSNPTPPRAAGGSDPWSNLG